MKTLAKIFFLIATMLLYYSGFAQYASGNRIIIKERHEGDLYVAANKMIVENTITGDLIAAIQHLEIRDSILGDLTTAGAYVYQWGYVGDDMRCFGGKIDIKGSIGDDLLVFGGDISINDGTKVQGDLIAYGADVFVDGQVKGNTKVGAGQLIIDGTIEGKLEFKGEGIVINGTINQDVKIVANDIRLGNTALIAGNLEYWSPEGEIDIDPNLVSGSISFNTNLNSGGYDSNFPSAWAIVLIFIAVYIPAILLLLLFINFFFGRYLQKAAPIAKDHFAKSLGFGILYLLAIPTIIIALFTIIIGIPLSLFLMVAYIFSLLFGHIVASLIVVYYLENKNQKNWSYWNSSFYALGILLIIRLITLIPFIGWLGSTIIIAVAYGSIILTYKGKQEKNPL